MNVSPGLIRGLAVAGTLLLSFLAFAPAAHGQRDLSLEAVPANESRVALVIGNSAYKESPLRNPVNDASDVAAALRQLGFQVTLRTNANQKQMKQALRDFGQAVKRGGVGLFYFAGHGVQSRGRNFLIPVGASIESEAELEDESVDASLVLSYMEEAQNRVNIVVLDACRNNPFARGFRSASRGLAQMDATKGSFIAFATAPGSVAADGGGRNGIYTKHLLQSLRTVADADIERVFKRVRQEVVRETGGKQVPWESSSLIGDFYFRAGAAGLAATAGRKPAPQPESRPQASISYVPVQGLGSVGISSRAAGAEVWLDDNRIGEIRPGGELLVSNLESGRHRVLARKDKRTWEQTIDVAAGEKTSVSVAIDSSIPALSPGLVSEVVNLVEKNYVTQPDFGRFMLGALRGLEKTLPAGTLAVSQTNDGAALSYVSSGKAPTRVVLASPGNWNDLQREVMYGASLAREVAPAIDQTRLEEAVLGNALASLDPHSDYLSPEQYREIQIGSSGVFGGIGAEVGIKDDELTVVAPIEGAPAERAGIRAKDRIVAINGNPTKGVKLMDAVKQMRGFPASKVTLSVLREGWSAPQDFVIVRENIRVQSVKSRDLEPGIGYIAIRQFQQGTPEAMQAALDKWSGGLFGGSSLKGLVLDLRNNPGGVLSVAAEVAGNFLDEGKLLVTTEGRTPESRMRLTASAKKRYLEFPIVIMVNEGSASASEIVAGALQDSNRAIILGNRTFGKGSVQTIFPLAGGGTALKLTTALYRTPSGRLIDGQGIEPNILMPMAALETPEPAKDIQLQQSLTRLKAMIAGK